MIKIIIDKTIKCPGILSALISFNYNDEIIAAVKSCQCHIYNKKEKNWEIDITSLPQLLDKLTIIDDIQLIQNELGSIINQQLDVDKSNFKTQPFDYQLEGINYGINHNSWLLLDAPGLGKTLQIIYIAEQLKKQKGLEHCLIICGINTLKQNWKVEIQKHSSLSCMILGERITKKGRTVIDGVQGRLSNLKSKINEFFIITNIETLREDKIIKEINNGVNKIDMIVVDEIHACKSPTSMQGKNLLKLNKAAYKIGLTGTIIMNSPIDVYVPMKWIGVEHSNFSTFKNYYIQFGGLFNNEIIGYKNINILKSQLENNSLRRTKDLLSLPEKTIINEFVEMNLEQRKFYDDIMSGVFDQINKISIDNNQVLSLVIRLRQAMSCPSILTTNLVESSKINRAVDLANQIISNNEKIVIFSIFKETLKKLKELLGSNALICSGDQSDEEIRKNINLFSTSAKYNILLCTPQKMGTGITLTAASYMIFIDCPWTAAACEQCEDRIHRIGSKQPVFIYYLWNTDSFDLQIKKLIEDKSIISDWIVDSQIQSSFIERLKNLVLDLKIS